MSKKLLSLMMVIALLAGSVLISTAPAAAEPSTIAEVTGFADADPLRLWYNQPANIWAFGNSINDGNYNGKYDALPLGNGFIGGMVYGGVDIDRIQINEKTLWSGGPGKNSGYNGGHGPATSATAKANLQLLRQSLQTRLDTFNISHTGGTSGTVGGVTAWNPANTAGAGNDPQFENTQEKGWINTLQGDHSDFGSYQSFGDLLIADATKMAPKLLYGTSDAEPSGDEKAINLFNGSNNGKFYASRGVPVTISWGYDQPYTFQNYTLTTGNDMDARDPSAFTLHGSNDDTPTKSWTLIDTQTAAALPTGRQADKTFNTTVRSFKHYELRITAVRTAGNNPQLTQIRLNASGGPTPTPVPSDYTRTLDLRTAVHTVSYTLSGVKYTRETFISNPGNVMVVRLSASAPNSITRRIAFTSDQTKKTVSAATAAGQGTISITGQPADQRTDNNALHFAGTIKVIPSGGTIAVSGGEDIDVTGANEVLVIFSCGTNYHQNMEANNNYFKAGGVAPVAAAALSRVNTAAAKTYVQLLNEHVTDHNELFGRVELNFSGGTMPAASSTNNTTDRLLARYGANYNGYTGVGTATNAEKRYVERLYYQYGRYMLIASSRPGSLPANLQGIWADGLNPPWAADYHTNINLQMNYWPAQQTNLAECHIPMIDYTNSLVPRGTQTAQYYYTRADGTSTPVRGWVIGHENNVWGNTGPGNWYWGFLCTEAAAWMCQDIWEYYAFTKDEAFLAANFPTMLSAAQFWLDNLWVDQRAGAGGKLVANPSYSPEHGPYTLGASSAQAIIWELFENVLKAADVLGNNHADIANIATAQSNLLMPTVGSLGQYKEWRDEYLMDLNGDGNHRHVNHLYALHPGTNVIAGRSTRDDTLVTAMKNVFNPPRSTTTRSDVSTGWSVAWKMNIWARMRDGNRAGKLVGDIIKNCTLKNMFDTHTPFQIDGNFGATAGMTEMLLHSQGDMIELLPAISTDWGTNAGSVKGLKARGNYTVDISWLANKVSEAKIVAGANTGTEEITVSGPAGIGALYVTEVIDGVKYQLPFTVSGNTLTFETEAGSEYIIGTSQGIPKTTPITAVNVTVTAPVPGAAPSAAAVDADTTGFFTPGAVAWSPVQNPFGYEQAYTATVTLTAALGKTFEDISPENVKINGSAATITGNTGAALTVSYTFAAFPLSPVTSAAVSVTAPVPGQTPVTTGSDAGGTGSFTVSSVSWSPGDSPFKYDTLYTATVTLSAAAGKTFAGFAAGFATINGYTAAVTGNTGNTLTLTYTFAATPQPVTTVSAVTVTVTAPVPGATPNTTASALEAPGEFTIDSVTWSPGDSPFEYEKAYSVTVALTAAPGKSFMGILAGNLKINGATASIAAYTGATLSIRYTFPAVPRTPIGMVSVVVTPPAIGTPPFTVCSYDGPAGDYTIGQVTWSPGGPVEYDTAYSVTVALTADTGKTFAGILAENITINGFTSEIVSNTGTNLTIQYTFAAIPSPYITNAAILVIAPVPGETPVNQGWEASGLGKFSVSSVSWAPVNDPFKANTLYTVTVKIAASPGYDFLGLTGSDVNINGFTATVISNKGTTMTLTYTFAAVPPAPPADPPSSSDLTDLFIEVAPPVPGVAPVNAATPASPGFSVSSAAWAPVNNPFKAGTLYTVTIKIAADPGKTFANIPAGQVKVNGNVATIISNKGATMTLTYTFAAT
ncbi:MAG: glycoside hydrolase N-terminal domain-containing protein [Oscillospiraceae bacterium]|nr:glycoside hydrolase N-terminal domain-containing protein [Oscillospiraceae bacterium]